MCTCEFVGGPVLHYSVGKAGGLLTMCVRDVRVMPYGPAASMCHFDYCEVIRVAKEPAQTYRHMYCVSWPLAGLFSGCHGLWKGGIMGGVVQL